jgi:hypothetical protein
VNEDGVTGGVPVTVTENILPLHNGSAQILLISKVPVVGGVGVTVVLPSGHVSATAQADCSWLLLAVAVLVILFVLSAVALELELLSAEFVFVFMFVFGSRYPPLKSDFLYAKEFCIIGNIDVAPTTSMDVIAATIRMPLIVWFVFFSQ